MPAGGAGVKEARVRMPNTSWSPMKDPRITFQPMICVAEVDTRLTCSTYCPVCAYYVRERRIEERRTCPRPTHDRRILGRI
jgi:hypothetical protein